MSKNKFPLFLNIPKYTNYIWYNQPILYRFSNFFYFAEGGGPEPQPT